MASNAENVSIGRRHHGVTKSQLPDTQEEVGELIIESYITVFSENYRLAELKIKHNLYCKVWK